MGADAITFGYQNMYMILVYACNDILVVFCLALFRATIKKISRVVAPSIPGIRRLVQKAYPVRKANIHSKDRTYIGLGPPIASDHLWFRV